MDHVPPERRSFIMRMVKTADTRPELTVRKLLHNLGFRFRLRNKRLPGTPDVVLSKWRAIVLIHGCFWHRHERCRKATIPKTKRAYWLKKFKANVRRDSIVTERLHALGWRVCIVWQCELDDLERLSGRLASFITKGRKVQKARRSPLQKTPIRSSPKARKSDTGGNASRIALAPHR